MTAFITKRNQQQIIQSVHDESDETLRVKVVGGSNITIDNADLDVELDATDGDSVMIVGTEDGTATGTQHTVKVDTQGRVAVTGSGFTGTFTEVPPTDFRVKTVTATNTATSITFSSFTMVSVIIQVLPDSTAKVRYGKSDIATNYAILFPGSVVSLPLQASTSPVFYVLDGAGDATLSITALGS